MSRRADALTYYVSDSDIRALQRLMGEPAPVRREPKPLHPSIAYLYRITRDCPCDPCLQRRTCRAPCPVYDAWVRLADRGLATPTS